MSEFVAEKKPEKGLNIVSLTPEERQGLVAVFAWLIQEDKKQNPDLYKQVRAQSND